MLNKCAGLETENRNAHQKASKCIQLGRVLVSILALFSLIGLSNCNQTGHPEAKPDPIPSQTFNEDGSINVYIEIPAGSNIKYELNKNTNDIEPDQKDGVDRVIDFLPYPGNYGFIAGTHMAEVDGGDGDALDVLILCDSRPKGTAMKVKPIGVIMLKDRGELDHKVIAVPFDEDERTINVEKFSSFITKYNAAQFIVQEWFLNYKGVGKVQLQGWRDEEYAMKEIKKWSLDANE